MISFRCICGEPMDVPSELAGEQLQCPTCRRLVDVPRPEDVVAFADDGTVKLEAAETRDSALEEKLIAFSAGFDMRPTVEEFMLAGTGPEPDAPQRRPTPRYDPVTGELMVPVEITNDDLPPPPVVDVNAPVLGYARQAVGGKPSVAGASKVTWWNLPWHLLTGMSFMAMLVVFVLHVIISLLMMMPGFSILWLLPTLGVTVAVIAHYCNTMEDFGPGDRDRVPVLLRSASLSEDVFRPMFFFLMALLYAVAPLMLVTMFTGKHFYRDHEWVLYGLQAWALLVFPLAAFTTVCGGTLHNLMPKQIISTVQVAPGKLMLAMTAFYLGLTAYGIAGSFIEIKGPSAFAATMPSQVDLMQWVLSIGLTIASYAVAVYLTHIGAAWMGLIYRDHSYDLNWVLQRHEKDYRTDTAAELFRRRGRPVVTPGDPNAPQLPTQPKRVLPLQQHEGFEVKL